MTQPVQEPTEGRTLQSLGFTSRQLLRRPSSIFSSLDRWAIYETPVTTLTPSGTSTPLIWNFVAGTPVLDPASFATFPTLLREGVYVVTAQARVTSNMTTLSMYLLTFGMAGTGITGVPLDLRQTSGPAINNTASVEDLRPRAVITSPPWPQAAGDAWLVAISNYDVALTLNFQVTMFVGIL